MQKIKSIVLDVFITIVGCFIFSYAFYGFLKPNEIAIGGVGGISAAIMSSFDLKMGVLIFSINVPILILAWIFLGKKFTINTTLVILSTSLLMDYIMPYLPTYENQRLLGTIFGGCFLGLGIGLIFTRGFTTGGTDIIGRLLQLKFPFLSIGKLMLIVDFIIICVSSYIYTLGDGPNNGIDSAMYGLIATFVYTKVIDAVLLGGTQMKVIYIISNQHQAISDILLKNINRGLTKVNVDKVYSKQEGKMIMCVARANELFKVKKLVKDVDEKAFVIILDSNDVVGGNFQKVKS